MSSNIIGIIPAYEPEAVLLDLLEETYAAGMQIIVVDDGSGVEYAPLFTEAANFAIVLTHSVNKGKGCALKTALEYIQDHFTADSIIVTIDADGQHRVHDAVALCGIVQQHPDALALGSRRLIENVPLRSRFGNSITRMIYRLSTGLQVQDTQTGLRAFSIHLIPQLLRISGDRYEYEMNILLEFARSHIPILEMEIETIYIDNNAASHFNTLKDSFRIYKEILKFSASSFVGFLIDYAVYSLLLLLAANLRFANIVARLISASVNYSLNRKFVFRNRAGIMKSLAKYSLMAIVILIGNTFVLELLAHTYGMDQMVAKLVTEIIFFLLSWLIQRFIVFRQNS